MSTAYTINLTVKNALFISAIALMTSSPSIASGVLSAQEKSGTPPKVQKWIENLQADSYQIRQNASKKLVAAGRAAIDPLFLSVQSEDPEVSFRSVHLLQKIGTASDLDTLEEVIRKSVALPAEYSAPFSKWCSRSLNQWKEVQSDKAVEELVSAGASVTQLDSPNLQLLLVDEVSSSLNQIKQISKTPREVLQEIQQLRNLQAGKPATLNQPDSTSNAQVSNISVTGATVKVRGIGERLVFSSGTQSVLPRIIRIDHNWKGSAADLAKLRMVFDLGTVEFVERKVTREHLAVLKQLGGVQTIQLTRCTFSFSELSAFKKTWDPRNEKTLMATGAGYLGVYGPNNGEPAAKNGSYVSMVSPESAAMEAGLERGDVITQVDDDKINSFAELSLAISAKPAGKNVNLKIRRRGDEINLTARLKSRAEILR